MARNYLAFDIETAKILPKQVQDLKAHRPLGIACAATLTNSDSTPRLWYGRTDANTHSPRMCREDAVGLVEFLAESTKDSLTILTWNGLGFDFDILAEESGMVDECRQLAAAHVDMMFQVFCQLGYPIALDRAARGMGMPGKSSSVPQYMAPQYWADGRVDEVLNYVSQDVRATLELAHTCERKHKLCWITQRGRTADMRLDSGWLTVESAMRLPEPDTSWMDNPKSRSQYTDWFQPDD